MDAESANACLAAKGAAKKNKNDCVMCKREKRCYFIVLYSAWIREAVPGGRLHRRFWPWSAPCALAVLLENAAPSTSWFQAPNPGAAESSFRGTAREKAMRFAGGRAVELSGIDFCTGDALSLSRSHFQGLVCVERFGAC